jgi:serine phosphatase RsbU (regulator of sigma subunit)
MIGSQEEAEKSGLYGSLRFRLALSVLLTVLGIVGLATVVDYRREHRVHTRGLFAALDEQARALQTARQQITEQAEFARFVDEFCAQMNEYVSPGHHILVLDHNGNVIVRARHHSGEQVEQALLSSSADDKIVLVTGHKLAQVRIKDHDGASIVVAQYLDHMESILRGQLVSRALSAAVTAIAIIALVFLSVNQWVLKPLSRLGRAAKAWAERKFATRCAQTGPDDLDVLIHKFNSMAGELEKHERKRLTELVRAREIQKHLLPDSVPSVPGLSVAADNVPVEHVAGDLYDVFDLPDAKTAIAILDVVGHGISAALLTGVVKMSLHWRLTQQKALVKAVCLINRDILDCVGDEEFVTACVGIWDPAKRTWTYCAAGHPGGLWLTDGDVRVLPNSGPLLGVLSETQWSTETIQLQPGDRMFLYTDGIVEAGGPEDILGLDGLEQILQGSRDISVADQIGLVMSEVAKRNPAKLGDDVTLVGFEVLSDYQQKT